MERTVQSFLALFEARDSDGQRRYARSDLLAALPFLLAGVDLRGPLPAALAPLLEEAASLLGVKPAMNDREAREALASYRRAHPRVEMILSALRRGP